MKPRLHHVTALRLGGTNQECALMSKKTRSPHHGTMTKETILAVLLQPFYDG